MWTQEPAAGAAERLVRQYFEALRHGRIVDALDVFATDAVFQDANGDVHRGIRAIAASFAHTREPLHLDIVALSRNGDRVTAMVEIRGTEGGRPLRYRDVFHIDGKRVRSLTVASVRGRTVPRKVSVPPRSAPSHC